MKKHYDTPKIFVEKMLVDIILASGNSNGIDLGQNDWGVQDDFDY